MVKLLVFFSLVLIAPLHALSADRCRPDGGLCQAFWFGYEFDAASGTCQVYSASGCSNPFSYHTLSDCQLAHPDGNGFTCTAYWQGWEYNARDGGCVSVSASGCRDPFRYHSKQECERTHPKCQG